MDKPKIYGACPVSLQWANRFGSNAHYLPDPISGPILGTRAPVFAGDHTRALLPDGSIWEYLGISGNDVDNKERVNGWLMIQKTTRKM